MKEQRNIDAFLALVRAGLWEKNVQLSPYGTIDYNDVYQLSQEQSVLGLVTAGFEHVTDINLTKDIVLKFIGETLQQEQRNKDMNRFVSGLIGSLRHVNIYTLLLKGQGIAQCYERPLWRACGDVDLFLSDENYIKAKDYLLPQASSSDQETKYGKHLALTLGQWTVELHGRLCISLSTRVNNALDTIKKETFYEWRVRSWMNGNVQTFLLSPENDALYVFAYLLNHFY